MKNNSTTNINNFHIFLFVYTSSLFFIFLSRMSLPGPIRRRCDSVFVSKGGVLRTMDSIQSYLIGCEVEPDDRIIDSYIHGTVGPQLSKKTYEKQQQQNSEEVGSTARQRVKAAGMALGNLSARTKSQRHLEHHHSLNNIREDSQETPSPTAQSPISTRKSATLGPPRIPLDDCYWLVKECMVAQAKKQMIGNDEQLLSMAWSAMSGTTDTSQESTAKVSDFESQIQSFGLRCGNGNGGAPTPTNAGPSSPTGSNPSDYYGDDVGRTMRFADMMSMLTIDKDILVAVSESKTAMVKLPSSLLRQLTLEEQQKAQRIAKALFRLKLMLRSTVAFRRANKAFEKSLQNNSPTFSVVAMPSSGRLKGGLRHGAIGGGADPQRSLQSRRDRMETIRRLSLFDTDTVGNRCRRHSQNLSVADCFTPTRSPSPYRNSPTNCQNNNGTTPSSPPPLPRIQPGFSSSKLQGDLIRERTLLPPLQDDRRNHEALVKKMQREHIHTMLTLSMSPDPYSTKNKGIHHNDSDSLTKSYSSMKFVSPVVAGGPRLLSSRHEGKHDAETADLSPTERLQFWQRRLHTITNTPSSHNGDLSNSAENGLSMPLFHKSHQDDSSQSRTKRTISNKKVAKDFCAQVTEEDILAEIQAATERRGGGGSMGKKALAPLAGARTRKQKQR